MNLIIPDPMGIYIFSVCPRLQLLRQTEETGDMGRIRGKRGESGTADRRLETGDRRQATGRKVAQCQTQTRVQTARHRHQTPQSDSNARPKLGGSLYALIDATYNTQNAWTFSEDTYRKSTPRIPYFYQY